MRVWRVNQLSLLEKVKKFADFKSDVLSNAVGSMLSFGEIFEHGAQRGIEFLEHGLSNFELFLDYKTQV